MLYSCNTSTTTEQKIIGQWKGVSDLHTNLTNNTPESQNYDISKSQLSFASNGIFTLDSLGLVKLQGEWEVIGNDKLKLTFPDSSLPKEGSYEWKTWLPSGGEWNSSNWTHTFHITSINMLQFSLEQEYVVLVENGSYAYPAYYFNQITFRK